MCREFSIELYEPFQFQIDRIDSICFVCELYEPFQFQIDCIGA
jgi:hypothetical protein